MKIIKNTILSVIFVLIFLQLVSNLMAGVIITEVMPDNGADDWIEFCVTSDGFSLNGLKIYEGSSLIKTLPDITLNSGDYFVLNFAKSGATDDTEKGENGYLNFYTSDSGLTGTDNTIILKDASGNYLDALCWSNNDGTWSTTNKGLFETLVSTRQWISSSSSESECFVGPHTISKSISRKYNSQNQPIDTNTKDDWQVLAITKGGTNKLSENNIKILINEVMPDNGDDDWIEFFVASGSGTIKNFELRAGDTLVKTFSDVQVTAGDYFVLNFAKTDIADETSKGEKGYFNFYTSDSGLTATDNTLILKDSNENYLDALCWSNNDGTWSQTNSSLFQTLVSTGQWIASSAVESECFVWTPTEQKSISRKYNSQSQPIDTNTKNDWELTQATRGKAKEIVLDDFTTDVDLKLLNTHFSPYGDYKNKTIKVKFKNKQNVNLRAKIYDINLHLILTLIDTNDEQVDIKEWDGKNSFGNIMPVGVYIVYYEFVDKTKGLLKKGKKAVVLGKAL